MTSVEEHSADAPSKALVAEEVKPEAMENGDAVPVAEEEHGNDKGDAELEIQNNEDLETLVDDDDEKDRPRRRSWDRTRGRERRNSRDRERDRDRDRDRDRGRRRSRSPDRSSRRDQSRRDPNKSSKDIEQDKARAKKDNDSKALAEKEKAIKTLLDSNDVVPPGTEEEAIQIIAEKGPPQQKDEDSLDGKRSRDNRKRSPIHARLGPRRSPRRRSKSPVRFSPRRRSPSSDRRRRSPPFEFFTRKRSNDRDPSSERREASRRRLRERRERERSRSRDRHRSRSLERGRRSRSYDRRRSRSFDRRRRSRSYDRHSPRRRRSASRSRSPTRPRRRSPFINELARQFSSEALRPGADGPLGPMGGPPGGPYMPGPGGPPGAPLDPRMMPGGGPPGLLPLPGAPGMPPGPMDVHSVAPMHPGGLPIMHPGGPPFGGFEPVMGFDPLSRGPPGPDYGPGPVLYNQHGVPMGAPVPRPITPQPVPAPGLPMYPGGMMQPIGSGPALGAKYSPNLRDSPERMRTPEPPIISDFKPNEKTSLSSLLEASVSQTFAKDTSILMPTFKGFKPEVIRQCERALRSLPTEDPRLNMKGRFFFDPNKKLVTKDTKDVPTSNSVLLRKGRTEIHWEEEFNQMNQVPESKAVERKRVITLQKICQTEETTRESIAVQTEESTKVDFGMQVTPDDLLLSVEDRRPLTAGGVNYDERRNNYEDRHTFDDRGSSSGRPYDDRSDWNMRDSFDTNNSKPTMRDNEDLRWSLSNNQNRSNPWNRGSGNFSPPRPTMTDHMHGGSSGGPGMDFRNLDMMLDRPVVDNVGKMMDRIMTRSLVDFRERDMRELNMREREMDLRGMDLPRDRELVRSDGGRPALGGRVGPTNDFGRREKMEDFGRREPVDEFGRREPVDEFGRREPMDNFGRREKMNDFGRRESMDDFGRREKMDEFGRREPMDKFNARNRFNEDFTRDTMDLDMNESMSRGRDSSPTNAADEGDDLEIIEEHVFDHDSWQRVNSGAQLNNARGGAGLVAAMRNANPSLAKRATFRGGRIGSFRSKF